MPLGWVHVDAGPRRTIDRVIISYRDTEAGPPIEEKLPYTRLKSAKERARHLRDVARKVDVRLFNRRETEGGSFTLWMGPPRADVPPNDACVACSGTSGHFWHAEKEGGGEERVCIDCDHVALIRRKVPAKEKAHV